LDGALDLRNTEDVDQDVRYAPAVTKEVVKPIVHERIEEHITRDIHTHDVYQKILPVRDVEVLPARHWVPGPDGQLVQVDEKDVYSGVAFSQAQQGQGQVNTAHQHKESLVLGSANQPLPVTGETENITQDTVKHTSINPPKMVPAQVNRVFEDQTHQYVVQQQVYDDRTQHQTMEHHQIPRKPLNNEEHSTGAHIAFEQNTFGQTSNSQQQPLQTHTQRHPVVQHEINRYQPVRTEDSTRGQESVYQTPVSQYSVPEGHVPSRQTEQPIMNQTRQGEYSPAHQHGQEGHSLKHQHGQEGLLHHRQHDVEQDAVDQQLYQEQGIRQTRQHTEEPHQTGNQGRFMHEGSQGQTSAVSPHSPLNRDQADAHGSNRTHAEKDNGQTSPGLLDPYRVKNGPVHHPNMIETGEAEKPLPDVPETHVKKIAGHGILTTEDGSGHSKLHKEPKESKHRTH